MIPYCLATEVESKDKGRLQIDRYVDPMLHNWNDDAQLFACESPLGHVVTVVSVVTCDDSCRTSDQQEKCRNQLKRKLHINLFDVRPLLANYQDDENKDREKHRCVDHKLNPIIDDLGPSERFSENDGAVCLGLPVHHQIRARKV